MWSVMLQESLRGGDHVYLCTGVWTPAFSALIKWVSPGIQDFLHVKVLYEDKVFLSFHKNIKYKLCWEEQGFTSPLWHSPFIPYSHHVILLQSPKMYKSAFNLDLFFWFQLLEFWYKTCLLIQEFPNVRDFQGEWQRVSMFFLRQCSFSGVLAQRSLDLSFTYLLTVHLCSNSALTCIWIFWVLEFRTNKSFQ